MKKFLAINKLYIAGAVLGAIAGFAYWNYVGCASGTCSITSKPINSTVYGSLMGFLFMGLFKKEPNKHQQNQS